MQRALWPTEKSWQNLWCFSFFSISLIAFTTQCARSRKQIYRASAGARQTGDTWHALTLGSNQSSLANTISFRSRPAKQSCGVIAASHTGCLTSCILVRPFRAGCARDATLCKSSGAWPACLTMWGGSLGLACAKRAWSAATCPAAVATVCKVLWISSRRANFTANPTCHGWQEHAMLVHQAVAQEAVCVHWNPPWPNFRLAPDPAACSIMVQLKRREAWRQIADIVEELHQTVQIKSDLWDEVP